MQECCRNKVKEVQLLFVWFLIIIMFSDNQMLVFAFVSFVNQFYNEWLSLHHALCVVAEEVHNKGVPNVLSLYISSLSLCVSLHSLSLCLSLRHYPKTSFTTVKDTPENMRLRQQSELQSQVSQRVCMCVCVQQRIQARVNRAVARGGICWGAAGALIGGQLGHY